MPVLQAKNLKKDFGKLTALDGLDLEVGEGEVVGFIGPNGAGKSTAIRVLLGILKSTREKAEIFGKNVWKDAVEIHQRLAYVPEIRFRFIQKVQNLFKRKPAKSGTDCRFFSRSRFIHTRQTNLGSWVH